MELDLEKVTFQGSHSNFRNQNVSSVSDMGDGQDLMKSTSSCGWEVKNGIPVKSLELAHSLWLFFLTELQQVIFGKKQTGDTTT